MVQSGLDVHAMVSIEDEQLRDEIATFFGDVIPNRPDKLPLTLFHVEERLAIIGTSEWTVAAQQDVSDDTDRPHVLTKTHAFAQDDFRCNVFRLSELQWSQSVFNSTSQTEVTNLQTISPRMGNQQVTNL